MRRPERLLVAICLAAAVSPQAARAAFTPDPAPVSASVSSGTLAAPTGATAAVQSCVPVTGPVRVRVSWTASASSFATGYRIRRGTAAGGPYTTIGTVSGRTTTSYDDTSAAFSTTYRYVVQSTRNSWSSANSTEAAVATPNLACV